MNKGKKKPDLTGRKVDGSPGLGGEVAAATMKCGSALVLNELAEGKWLQVVGSPQNSLVV